MKKLYLLAIIFFMVSSSLNAMKRKSPEKSALKELIEIRLTPEEAKNLYWDSVELFNNQTIPYSIYRANLMIAIPFLNYTQDYVHNPLAIAVKARDYEFVEFLLEFGADPLAKDISQKTAFDMLNEQGGLTGQKMNTEFDVRSKGPLKSLLESYIKKEKNPKRFKDYNIILN